jgi:hypothetical protein
MSVMFLDVGNGIIMAKIARCERGEIAFPHAFKPLTVVEYSSIVSRSGKQSSSQDYIRINGQPYMVGDSAEKHEVLNAWIEKGFSTRFFLTKALLELDHPGSFPNLSQDDLDLGLVFDQIGQLLEIVKANPIAVQSINLEQSIINESFLGSIKQGVKPGMKSA